MKHFIYLASGTIFGLGLCFSGMIDPFKIKAFLSLATPNWNPALLVVLGVAMPVYAMAHIFLRRRGRTLDGAKFNTSKPQRVDKKLIAGSVLFGVGWGIAGICPGPALVHLSFLDSSFAVFVVTMFLGFELQKRIS